MNRGHPRIAAPTQNQVHPVPTRAGRQAASLALASVLVLAASAPAATTPTPTSAQLDFFESKIRPVLAEHCYKCHSAGAEKIKGGLTLDTRDGVARGGDSGPALVPGKPADSLLIKAVRYDDTDLQMPPGDKKLPDQAIRDLEQWVAMGAPDPRTEAASARQVQTADLENARRHWAYKPVERPPVPSLDGAAATWAQNDVDRFIAAAMAPKGLSPSKPADKTTLLRRATFDLHGLPPTVEEVKAFVHDLAPDAWSKVIDRLLASPRYGERWGRHWLDLAKYADTSGRAEQGRDNRYLWSWTYRDWVIRAWNEDLPYDQFLMKQIAADQMDLPDKRDLAAMGFLTLGNRFGNNANDVIDDRIDLLGKSTMAMTLACSRCHDHKFDPIPTRDYYSLHGVFSSSAEPREGPIVHEPGDTPLHREFLRQWQARQDAVDAFVDKIERGLKAERRLKVADYLLAWHEYRQATNGVARGPFMQRRGLDARVANAWSEYLKPRALRHHRIWAPWFAFTALDDTEFVTKGKALAEKFVANAETGKPLNPHVARLFVTPPVSLAQVAARYSSLFNQVARDWEAQLAAYETQRKSSASPPPPPVKMDDADLEDVREVFYKASSPALIDDRAVRQFIQRDNQTRNTYNDLVRAVNDVRSGHPGAPARAHVLEDIAKPRNSYVMVKGNPGNRGAVVPRQAPAIIAPHREPFASGSGRLELARTIASRQNPLTARVIMNRLWLLHFGNGLVATPDDFGLRSDPPSHPELLDYLAARLVDEHWSLKAMHRVLMGSATYQQSSDENPRFAQMDPGNRYYWQFNRQRLSFEALRDTVLYIGGRLDFTPGGPGVPLDREPYPTRRSVYGYIDRARLPNMLLAFDFANPDLTTGRRNETIVPQQALFMMNSPLVIEQARNLTLRPDFKAASRPEDRIQLLYQLIYQRPASEIELRLGTEFVQNESRSASAAAGAEAWEYGYGEYEPAQRRMKSFVQLNNFRGAAWTMTGRQAAKAGPVSLNAKGGRPGNGPGFAAVRRWIARKDGFVSIDGALAQMSKDPSDVVVGWIVSSGTGQLMGPLRVQGNKLPTKIPRVLVKRGDTLDFVVTGKGPFAWSPQIRAEAPKAGEPAVWNAEKDFSQKVAEKHLEPWEKFAQVLLETNELTFVN
jgi:hypothetical protein